MRAILTIDEARVAKDWTDCLPNLSVAARLEKLGVSSVVPVLEKVPVRSAAFSYILFLYRSIRDYIASHNSYVRNIHIDHFAKGFTFLNLD